MDKRGYYREMGISDAVLDFGEGVLAGLGEQFARTDAIAEQNQAKVLWAMQKNRLAANHFNLSSGYGYDDEGRDNLERVYADVFHTQDAEAGTGGIALAALDGDELGLGADGPFDALIVKAAAGQQIHLPVGDAVLLEGAGGGADADDLLQRVIRRADRAEQLVTRKQIRAQRNGQRVRAAGDLGPYQRRLGAENAGIDALQIATPSGC